MQTFLEVAALDMLACAQDLLYQMFALCFSFSISNDSSNTPVVAQILFCLASNERGRVFREVLLPFVETHDMADYPNTNIIVKAAVAA